MLSLLTKLQGYNPVFDPQPAGGASPNLSSQDATQLLDVSGRGRVTTDTANGTLYWVATTSGTAPSAAQVKAGQDNGGSAATFAGNVSISSTGQVICRATGLTANTAYTMHFMHENAGTQQSSVVSSSAFTTYKANVGPVRNDLNDASWTKFNTTVSADTLAGPDGVVNADTLIEDTSTNFHSINGNFTVLTATAYEAVVYIKKGPGGTAPDVIQLTFSTGGFGAGVYCNYNLNTGAVGSKSMLITSSAMDNLGGGWFRCSATSTSTSTSVSAGNPCFTNNNDGLGKSPSYAGAITSDMYFGGIVVHVV